MTLPTVLIGSHTRIGDIRHCLSDLAVQVTSEYPDVAQCMRSLPLDPEHKFMFAMDIRSDAEIGDLEHLSKQYGWPCLAVVDDFEAHSPGRAPLWQMAMRAGASQVVARPLDGIDMEGAVHCLNRLFGAPAPVCTVIAVTGATGGSGSTTLAINLAHELSYLTGSTCILSELEGRVGMLASYLDLKPRHTVSDLTQMSNLDSSIVQQTLVPYGDRMSVLCGGQTEVGAHVASPTSAEGLPKLLAALKRMCQFLVLDVSCTLTPSYFDILSQADQVVIVAEQTLPSMRNLRLLKDSLGPMDVAADVDVVVNKFDPRINGFSLAGLKDIVGTQNLWTVEGAPSVVTGAINIGRPLRVHAERSNIVQDISKVARSLATRSGATDLKPEPSSSIFSFLRRLA